jgi:U3 small nucleolar RNA-associated protein 21
LNELKSMGPSAIDIEFRSFSVEMGGSIEIINKFLQFIIYLLTTKNNFELANAYLSLVLKIHGDTISNDDELINQLEKIKEIQTLAWDNLKINFNKNLCIVGYLKNVT